MRRMIPDNEWKDVKEYSDGLQNGSSNVNAKEITGDSIIENMEGYSAEIGTSSAFEFENIYTGAVKNGNKLTIVSALNITRVNNSGSVTLASIKIPKEIADKLFPTNIGQYNALNFTDVNAVAGNDAFVPVKILALKDVTPDYAVRFVLYSSSVTSLSLNTKYYVRLEITLLLSDNLIS